ncbi:glycosyltransferase family 4 protein [Psychroflexus tropicus]|uniref:glycosyltransferase family 4 protein n=1 Tax=Psychroflexus tropicus TaxID=197345 RepID=UPI00036F3787|nr:glycosyltransferase family 4 protein [Psychroflexus tropicus]
MKIAQVVNSLDTGGAEKLTIDFSRQLLEKAKHVDLIVLKKTKSIFDLRGLNIKFLSNHSLYNPIYIFKLVKHLKSYDLIHAHLFPTLYWVVLAKLFSFSTAKLVYTEHSTSNKRRHKFIFKILDRIIYSFIDEIICITEASRIELNKHLSRTNNIAVVKNAIILENYSKQSSYFDFFKDSFRLIQVSSFREQKDQMTVLRAMMLLPNSIKLILVGDGPLKYSHQKFVKENNLSDRVVFLGNRKDVSELLGYSDIVIQSSHYEGFGLTALEGMAAGKPVVASNVEGLNEVIGNYGILFEKGNHRELSKLVMNLYSDNEYYRKIKTNCLLRSKHFSIEKMTEEYIKIYNKAFSA